MEGKSNHAKGLVTTYPFRIQKRAIATPYPAGDLYQWKVAIEETIENKMRDTHVG